MLKTRLRLLGTVRAEELNALRDDWIDKTGATKTVHTFCCRSNVKKEKSLLQRQTADRVSGEYGQDTSGQSVGEMLGDFQVHKHRFCVDTYWVRDVRLWVKKHILERFRDLLKHNLELLERRFGQGVAEILKRAQFMLNLNCALAVLWMAFVILSLFPLSIVLVAGLDAAGLH